MTDYDATAHVTEEMKNPAIKAPVGILLALGVTYVLGLGLNIALSVCMGASWVELLSSPTGLPVAQLLYNVLGNKAGVAFMSLAAIVCNFTGASCLQAQARTAFALSRGNICRGLDLMKMRCCLFQSISHVSGGKHKLQLLQSGSMFSSARVSA
jgi:amino acid transporter